MTKPIRRDPRDERLRDTGPRVLYREGGIPIVLAISSFVREQSWNLERDSAGSSLRCRFLRLVLMLRRLGRGLVLHWRRSHLALNRRGFVLHRRRGSHPVL